MAVRRDRQPHARAAGRVCAGFMSDRQRSGHEPAVTFRMRLVSVRIVQGRDRSILVGISSSLENDAPADDGADHLDVLDVLGTYPRVVGRKHREVRELARRDRAFDCFVARRERTRRCV